MTLICIQGQDDVRKVKMKVVWFLEVDFDLIGVQLNYVYNEQDYSQNAAPDFCVRTREMTDALSDLLKTLTLMLSWRLQERSVHTSCMMITSPMPFTFPFTFYSRFDSLHLILMSLLCRKDKT